MKRPILAALAIGAMIWAFGALAVQSAQGQIMIRPNPIARPVAAPPAADQAGPTSVAADASDAFAYDLYAKLRTSEGERTNLFFSPYSISSALTMTRLGARGATASEMSATLHLPADVSAIETSFQALNNSLVGEQAKEGFSLSVANALWGQSGEPFLQDYLNVVKKDFDADLVPVDFITNSDASRKQINEWVAKKTQDKIKDLLAPGTIGPSTRLVLTNAIYFKGEWTNQFEPSRTEQGDFLTDRTIHADFMHQTDHFQYAEDDLCQMVKLPYVGYQVSMLILLPKEDKEIDHIRKGDDPSWQALVKLQDALNAQYVEKLSGQLAFHKVVLTLPKWHSTQAFSLGTTLADMGMKTAFTARADFSGINGRTDLFLSDVIHKAFVNVDENGTEAAAATAPIMVGAIARPETPVNFTADHPFIYLIVDNPSHAILFAGRLCDPSASE